MKVNRKDPPRAFNAGHGSKITIHDCGEIALEPDELITFVTEKGAHHDVCRKDFGFYITQSLNKRVRDSGFRAALMRNALGHYYVVLVEAGREDRFEAYLRDENQELVSWMDNDEDLDRLAGRTGQGR